MFRIAALLATALPLCAQSNDRLLQLIQPRKQVALVIGNSAYANQPLRNPINDARAIAEQLSKLSYDVIPVFDANRRSMGRAIDQFLGRLGSGDVALFYYAGHGVQVDGENYLIPVDFEGQDEIDVRTDAYSASRIQERMERSGAQLNILILDACRNNPLRGGSRAASRGLAAMSAGRGTFIAFATAPGRTASDGTGANGLFTEHLLATLPTPGLTIGELFDVVRERVDRGSGGQQLPWSQTSVVGRYSFVAGSQVAAPSPAAVNSIAPGGDMKVNPKDGLRYVRIQPGTFTMGCSPDDNRCEGNEKPAHQVTISKGFWLGQTPVTVGAWKEYVEKTDARMPPDAMLWKRAVNPRWKENQQPMVSITWAEGAAFCAAAGGRLPTEAEWEYAARAGSTGARYRDLDAIAWYIDNTGEEKIGTIVSTDSLVRFLERVEANGNGPKPVGMKQPNAWKLYDMLGNVQTWTADWYGEKYFESRVGQDPAGPPSGTGRVVRGSAWADRSRYVRVSRREPHDPTERRADVGVRCVVE